jgi:exodeoxyribonuclease-3
VAILSRGPEILVTRRRLPGDPKDKHSHYIEVVVDGIVVACLYAPNGIRARVRNSTTNSPG